MESISADENVAYGLSIGLGLNQVSEVKICNNDIITVCACMHRCMMKCNMNRLIWQTLDSPCPLILRTLPSLTDSLCLAQLIQVKRQSCLEHNIYTNKELPWSVKYSGTSLIQTPLGPFRCPLYRGVLDSGVIYMQMQHFHKCPEYGGVLCFL